ncbi:MAG: PA14 domain-containing protein [Planctomycetota bacterium]|nr:PA14 domain-containing protein [Planctomycetota bacterium]
MRKALSADGILCAHSGEACGASGRFSPAAAAPAAAGLTAAGLAVARRRRDAPVWCRSGIPSAEPPGRGGKPRGCAGDSAAVPSPAAGFARYARRTSAVAWASAFAAILAYGPSLASARPAFAGEGWFDPAWEYRRAVEIKPTGGAVAGSETGVVEIHTAGKALPDKADIRVTCDGAPVPFAVLQSGPGDFCRVAFRMKPAPASYCVWFGNPKAPPARGWAPERGLLLETRRYNDGDPNSLEKMREIIARSGPSFGANFVPNVFHGWNEFSREDRYVSIYRGHLNCPKEGEYEFATSSDDASFLLVDGKPVVDWPGWHGALPYAFRTGKIRLGAGVHDFEYLHVSGGAPGIAVAAWKPPDGRMEPIPPEAFTPVARGLAGRLESRTGPHPDFRVKRAGIAFLDEVPMVRWRFSQDCGPAASGPFRWEFGDGQRAEGETVEHWYLLPGLYEIRLSCRLGGREASVSAKLYVDQHDFSPKARAGAEDLAAYAGAVSRYDWSAADLKTLLRASRLLEEYGYEDARIAIARAVLSRRDGVDDDTCFSQAIALNFLLRDSKKDPDAALDVLRAAEERLKENRNLRAKINREIGDIYFYYKGDLDRALLEYDKVVGRYAGLEDNIVRVAKIKIGDIFRERGLREKASAQYEEAEKLRIHKTPAEQIPSRLGYLVHSAEDYLRRGLLSEASKAVDTWEWEFPKEKLRGHSTLLRALIAIRGNNDFEAIRQMETLVRVNPESEYAGRMLYMLAELYLKRNEKDKAVERLEDLVRNHRESEYAAEGEKKLKSLGRPVPGGESGKGAVSGGDKDR